MHQPINRMTSINRQAQELSITQSPAAALSRSMADGKNLAVGNFGL